MNKESQKEYEEFQLKQLEILQGHFTRCMVRCVNKLQELQGSESTSKESVK